MGWTHLLVPQTPRHTHTPHAQAIQPHAPPALRCLPWCSARYAGQLTSDNKCNSGSPTERRRQTGPWRPGGGIASLQGTPTPTTAHRIFPCPASVASARRGWWHPPLARHASRRWRPPGKNTPRGTQNRLSGSWPPSLGRAPLAGRGACAGQRYPACWRLIQ
jgi:hypothetical protein